MYCICFFLSAFKNNTWVKNRRISGYTWLWGFVWAEICIRDMHILVSVHVIFKILLEFWMSDEFFIGVHSRAWVCPCRSSQVSITWWKSWKRFPREGDSISSHSQSVWENSSQQSLQLIQGKGFYMYFRAQGLNLLRSLSDWKLNREKQGPLNYFDCPLDFFNYIL